MNDTVTRQRSGDSAAPPPVAPTPAPPPKEGLRDKVFRKLGKKKLDPAVEQKLKTEKAERDRKASEQKLRDQENKQAQKAGTEQVKYDARLEKMKLALAELKAERPATNALHDAMTRAIDAAGAILKKDPMAFAAAREALHSKEFSLHKIEEQAEKAKQGADKTARKTHPGAYLVADEIARHLTTATSLTRTRLNEIESERRNWVAQLEKPAATVKAGEVVKVKLSALLTTLLGEISDADDYGTRMETKSGEAKALFNTASLMTTAKEAAQIQGKLNVAASAMAEHDYAAAEAALELALTGARETIAAQGPHHRAWLKERAKVGPLKQQVNEQFARLGPTSDGRLADTVSELSTFRNDLNLVSMEFPAGDVPRAPGNLSYAEAVLIVMQAENGIAAVAARLDQFNAFAGAKALQRRLTANEFITARVQIETLEDMVAKVAPDVDPVLAAKPFRNELARIQAEWDKRCQNAHDHVSLDATAVTNALATLAKRVDDVSTPAGVTRAINDVKVDAAAQACFDVTMTARAAVDDLAAYDIFLANPFFGELTALAKRVAKRGTDGHYTQCAAEAAKITERARGLLVMLELQGKNAQEILAREIAGIPAQLATMWQGVEVIRDTARREIYATLHATYTTAFDGLRAVGRVQQIDLLHTALGDARTLAAEITDTVAEFDKSIGDALLSTVTSGRFGRGANSATLDDVQKMVAGQKALLKDHELRAFASTTVVTIDVKLDAVLTAAGSVSMAELMKRLAVIADEITAAEAIAVTQRSAYDALKQELAATAKLLEDPAFDHVPKVKQAMTATLADIRAQARQEGGVAQARPQLQNLTREIVTNMTSPADTGGVPGALAAAEQEFLDEEHKKALEKAAWAGHVDVMKTRLGKMPSNLSDDRTALLDRLTAADKGYRKTGDHGAAWAQFSAIRNRLELLLQNPGGLMMHARGQLPSVRARWITAAVKLKDGVSDLAKELDAVADEPELTDTMKKLAVDELNAVRGLFNTASFDKPVDAIIRANADDKVRAAAREEALREVRRMRDVIRNDQRLKMLSQRALLGRSFAGEISEASLALADMETNLLISL